MMKPSYSLWQLTLSGRTAPGPQVNSERHRSNLIYSAQVKKSLRSLFLEAQLKKIQSPFPKTCFCIRAMLRRHRLLLGLGAPKLP